MYVIIAFGHEKDRPNVASFVEEKFEPKLGYQVIALFVFGVAWIGLRCALLAAYAEERFDALLIKATAE